MTFNRFVTNLQDSFLSEDHREKAFCYFFRFSPDQRYYQYLSMMEENKLWELMYDLTPTERRNFTRWIRAFHPDSRIEMLKQLVEKGHDRQEAYQIMYPDGDPAQPNQGFRKLESQLASEIERFWVAQDLDSDKSAFQAQLLAAYNKRPNISYGQLTKAYNQARRILNKQYEKGPFDKPYFSSLADIHGARAEHLPRFYQPVPQEIRDQIDQADDYAWCCNKLEAGIDCLFQAKLWGGDLPEIFHLPQALAMARDSDNPTLCLLVECYDMAEDNPYSCVELSEKIKALPEETFSLNTWQILFNAILNTMVLLRQQEGEKPWNDHLIPLYEFGFERGLISDHGVLNPSHLINYVSLLCTMAQWDKAKQKIEEMIPQLAKEIQEEIRVFVECHYYFHSGRAPDKVITLANFKYQSILSEFRARFTALKLWYDQGDLTLFESELRNLKYRHRLTKDLPKTTRESYQARIKLMSALRNCKRSKDWEKLEAMLHNKVIPKNDQRWLQPLIDHALGRRGAA